MADRPKIAISSSSACLTLQKLSLKLSNAVEKTSPFLLTGIGFVSASMLAFEISLTRYLSITQNYHFAFLIVGLAFLGYGSSGTFFYLFRPYVERQGDRWLSLTSLLFALSIPASFLLSNSLPFDFLQLPWNRKQLFYFFPYYACLGLPFFFAGATISFALSRQAKVAHRIYFSDLVGAGMGSFFAVGVFLPSGEKGVFILISGLALLGCLLLSLHRRPLFLALVAAFFSVLMTAFLFPPDWLSFHLSPFKALPQAMKYPGARHHLTRINSFSRVDVFSSPAVRFAPGLSLLYHNPLPPQLGLSIDGGELSAVTGICSVKDENLAFLSALPSSLPYSLLFRPRVLVLEPRGGLDVLAALFFDAAEIKSVESNPLVLRLLQRDLASFAGRIYSRPDVSTVSAHPREALKKETRFFDLIVFGLPDVLGSGGTGLYGIGENYLFTVESFLNVLDLLSPDGLISQTMYLLPPPRQEAKILATWVKALEERNLEPASHIGAIRTWGTLSLLIKKTPFSEEDIKTIKKFCQDRLFDTVYFPGIKPEETNLNNQMAKPIYEELFEQLLTASGRKALDEGYLFSLRPPSDDQPFFFDFYKWRKWRAIYEVLGKNPAFFFEGRFLLLVLLAQAGGAAFIFIVLPLLVLKKNGSSVRSLSAILLYFGLIGAAFMLIEIYFIQKFVLFLGHPLYSISTVIFVLLFSSGMGSLSSKKILGRAILPRLRFCLFLLGVLGLIYLRFLPGILERLIGSDLGYKVVLTLLIVFPLGFLMGFPFPTGIRLLEMNSPPLVPWAWSVNAFSTVLHSGLAHLIALTSGFTLVLALAATAYLTGIFLFSFTNHGHKANA
ncbi:MAG: hypothetical protein ACUVV5_12135 [Candidatus Aminicenantales bacterium]